MAFRFLHIADLHLETAFGGRPETRLRLARATLDAFKNAIDLCLDEGVHALLIAGDAFDEDKFSLQGQEFLLSQCARLAEAGAHVFYVTGNHDPGGKRNKATGIGFEDAPEEVGPGGGLWVYRQGQPRCTRVVDEEGTCIGCVVGAGHSNAQVATNLAAKFKQPTEEAPVVGLLHTQVEAAQISDAHDRYAPSTREDYVKAEFDYWALGHVHLRQQVFDDLPVWYSGNLQGRNAKETGPKGGCLVKLEIGLEAQVRFVSLGPILWEDVEVGRLDACRDREALLDRLEQAVHEANEGFGWDGRDLCLRLRPHGQCPVARLLLQAEEREELESELTQRCGLLEVQLRPRELWAERNLTELENTPSVQQRALNLVRQLDGDDALLLELSPATLRGADKLGASTREERLAYLRERLAGLEEDLLDRCFDEGAWQ